MVAAKITVSKIQVGQTIKASAKDEFFEVGNVTKAGTAYWVYDLDGEMRYFGGGNGRVEIQADTGNA